jgi:hypothetical protein
MISEDGLKAYESAVHGFNRAALILCVFSAVCLGLARTPTMETEKLAPPGGVEFRGAGAGIPAGSYAVVLGPIAIAAGIQWCYRAAARCAGLRSSLISVTSAPAGTVEPVKDERLALPLRGSPIIWRYSRIARCETYFLLLIVGAGPLVCGYMLLWDYSHQFHFSQVEFNTPWGLWFGWPREVLRPDMYNNVHSNYHPSILAPWQAWLYLGLLLWSALLIWDMYRLLGVWGAVRPKPQDRQA